MNNEDFNHDNNIDDNQDRGQQSYNQGNSFDDNQNYNSYNPQNQGNGNCNMGSGNHGPGKDDNKWRKRAVVLGVVSGLVLVCSIGFLTVDRLSTQFANIKKQMAQSTSLPDETEKTEESGQSKLDTTEEAAGPADSVSKVVENVMPSIVSITTTATETVSDFFGRTYSEDVQGNGSGIIIGQNSNEVLVATNNHVISGQGATVEITFHDGKSVKGTVKGADPSADLAVVAVKFADIEKETIEQIKVISIGKSKETKVGEVAIAIGNALGYGQSVTVGHISALEREIAVEDSSMTLMQTDAAINPGNSGGALLNAKGQLIGINSVKTATTEVEGMGYAIPISDAQPIIENLMQGKSSSKEDAYLGIVGQDITKSNSVRFNIPMGVYVTEIAEGSPAKKAGLNTGMVIVGLDGKKVENKDDLMKVLSSLHAGDMVTINVAVNNGGKYETKEFTVTMGSKSELDKDSKSGSSSNGNQNPNQNPNGDNGNDFYNEDPFSFFGR
ncbi:S1C family serine protease [[Clostridium] polysaccharolyticum]|uniref:Serine protease Do n=1 Tax=[Clostridium] polysaccharolyticum TaxID=29364 RepID=A0A1I0EZP4_9FIRM|nr:trypsin-like peptidase domain-containing protein [[Clostridium] polysaccharolyticum]SET50413.1 serine protease Do [[Clostridium] polysaccharolyticum]